MRLLKILLLFCCVNLYAQENNTPGSTIPLYYSNDPAIRIKNKIMIPKEDIKKISFSEGLSPIKIRDTIALYSGDKIGFINGSGKFVIPPQYDTLYSGFEKGLAILGKKESYFSEKIKVGAINTKNKAVIPFIYQKIGERGKTTIPVKGGNNLWGFYSSEGKLIRDCTFEDFQHLPNGKVKIRKNEKWGLMGVTGKTLIDPLYKDIKISPDSSEVYVVESFPKWIVKDSANKTENIYEYDSITSVQSDLFKYFIDSLHGLITRDGNVLLPAEYEIKEFKNGNAAIIKNGNYGVVSGKGKIIVPVEYDGAEIDINGNIKHRGEELFYFGSYFKKISDKKRWGLTDKNNNVKIPLKYKALGDFSEGAIAAMGEDSLWGYLNNAADTSVSFKYKKAGAFCNGFARVSITDSNIFLINKKGKMVVSPDEMFYYDLGLFSVNDSSGLIRIHKPAKDYSDYEKLEKGFIKVRVKNKTGILDKTGAEVLPAEYDSISYFPSDNVFIVRQDNKTGFANGSGHFLLPLNEVYSNIFEFSEEFVRVLKGNDYGFLDRAGKIRISHQYANALDFHEGYAPVMIKGKWGYINKQEKLVVQPYYDEALPFRNGLAPVRTGNKWNLVNKEGRKQSSQGYDKIIEGPYEKWILIINEKKGLASASGKEILGPKYEKINDLGNGLIQVWKNGKTGVLDYQENFIIPIEHEHLYFDTVTRLFIIKTKSASATFKVGEK
jgi:hypothetical protein